MLEHDKTDKDRLEEKFLAFAEDDRTMDRLSRIFKVLGDPTRLKIIYALSLSTLNVSQLVDLLGMSQSSISHQLSLLKAENLVKNRKEGRKVYYSLDDDHVLSLFDEGYEHAKHLQNR
ncbi:MAG: metalloregulator ArsR/SmtB family transcription factor [Tissierellia bacterium]|nr:metalloregulator ArsR/SmtB family transcription factor [Tissierellia bacterium]